MIEIRSAPWFAPVDGCDDLGELGDRIVMRTWVVAPSAPPSGEPELSGLLGARWPERVMEARCLVYGDSGTLHPVVPDPGCTCGIYASSGTDDTVAGLAPRGRPLARGFVRLSGRIIEAGGVLRAQRAEVLGPVALSFGSPPLSVRAAVAAGANLLPVNVRADCDRYRVRWGPQERDAAEWLSSTALAMELRYGVPFVVLRPTGRRRTPTSRI